MGALLALVVGAAGCGASGGAGAALAKAWTVTSAGVRALGLCDDHPPAIVRAIAEADQAEAEADDGGGGKADAAPVSVDAVGAEASSAAGAVEGRTVEG